MFLLPCRLLTTVLIDCKHLYTKPFKNPLVLKVETGGRDAQLSLPAKRPVVSKNIQNGVL